MQAISPNALQVSRPGSQQRSVAASSNGLLNRLLRRRKPTLYQRCLAVHIAATGTLSALR